MTDDAGSSAKPAGGQQTLMSGRQVSPRAFEHPGPQPPEEPQSLVVAHFRALERLGSGSTGVVYRAIDETLQRTVALKLLPDELAFEPEGRRRLLREARAAAAITHPNIATIFEVGEDSGRSYIAMELVVGQSLRERLTGGGLELNEALGVGLQIARGVAAAHDKGFVHRDLKPENVMITPAGVVKVLDFGLAKGLHDLVAGDHGRPEAGLQVTVEGTLLGTPAYMSPEQALGQRVGVQSDVFSMGVVLYEMLANKRPFAGLSLQQLLIAIVRDAPEPLSAVLPQIDPDLEAIVMRCLTKDPAGRFENAGEVASLLEGFTGAPPTPQRRTPRSGDASQTLAAGMDARTGHPPRRRLAGVAMTVLAFAALVPAVLWGIRPSPMMAATPSFASKPAGPGSLRARALTSFASDDFVQDAALSPDGSLLCFSDIHGLWLQPTDGGPRRSLDVPHGVGDLLSPHFFPDGQRLLVVVGKAGHHTTWIVPLDGSAPRRQPDRLANVVGLSPDGLHVALAGEHTLEVAELGNDSATLLAPTISGRWIGAVRFSPDGSHVAYVDDRTLRVASIDGATTHRVLTEPRLLMEGVTTLMWPSPDRLVFGARALEPGAVTLQEITVDDDGRPLSSPRDVWTGRGAGLLALTTAGARIAVIPLDLDERISVAQLGPGGAIVSALGNATGVASSEASGNAVALGWMPDGRLAFQSNADSPLGIYAQQPQAADLLQLVAPPVESLEQVLRTGAIVFTRPTVNGGTGVQLYVKAPGEAERTLDVPAAAKLRLRCAAGDPSRCILAAPHEGAMTLRRIDLGGDRANLAFVDAPCQSIDDLAMAPSGDIAALVCTDAGVYVADLKQRSLRALSLSPYVNVQSLAFAPDGKNLFLTGIEGDSAGYALLSSALDGHGHMLVDSSNRWFVSPRVSSDGKTLAVLERIFHANVWLLEPR